MTLNLVMIQECLNGPLCRMTKTKRKEQKHVKSLISLSHFYSTMLLFSLHMGIEVHGFFYQGCYKLWNLATPDLVEKPGKIHCVLGESKNYLDIKVLYFQRYLAEATETECH